MGTSADSTRREPTPLLRERARRARRMARNVNDEATRKNLMDYAAELDARAASADRGETPERGD